MASQDTIGGSVKALWRYPVKSMAGTKIDEALVTEGGILGDRAYAVIDRDSGRVGSAKTPKKWAGLMTLAADFTAPPAPGAPLPPVRIVWPDGTAVTSDGGDPDARLSETLGRPVTLTTERPEAPSLERLDPLAEEETIVDIGELMMAGRFSDYAALHLITTATMARLAALRPDSTFTARRFRPNVTIATPEGATGFVENDWVGRELAIGDAVRLRISDPTPRCSVPDARPKAQSRQGPAAAPHHRRAQHASGPRARRRVAPLRRRLRLRHPGRHGEEGGRGAGRVGARPPTGTSSRSRRPLCTWGRRSCRAGPCRTGSASCRRPTGRSRSP